MYHQQTNWSQQTIEQTKVIQEVVSPEVAESRCTEQKTRSNRVPRKKRLGKRN